MDSQSLVLSLGRYGVVSVRVILERSAKPPLYSEEIKRAIRLKSAGPFSRSVAMSSPIRKGQCGGRGSWVSRNCNECSPLPSALMPAMCPVMQLSVHSESYNEKANVDSLHLRSTQVTLPSVERGRWLFGQEKTRWRMKVLFVPNYQVGNMNEVADSVDKSG